MSDEHFNVTINDHALVVEKKEESTRSACLWYSKKIGRLNTANDFSITFDVNIIKESSDYSSFDFSWGILEGKNKVFFNFNYDPHGYFHLAMFDGTSPSPNKWNYLRRNVQPNLAKPGKYNQVKIMQEGDICSIFFNEKLVIKQQIQIIRGNDIGFMHCAKIKWLFTNLVIKQMSI